jgi:ribosomal protein S18 acetylase RimI-like enzyme
MRASEIEIVPLERPFIKRAASIAAAAFRDEPGATAIIGKTPEKRERILRRHHASRLEVLDLPDGASRCAFLKGEMVGLMLTLAPGQGALSTATMLRLLWKMTLHATPATIWRGFMGSMDDEGHRPKQPHYYLETLAVEPDLQGRGIGTAMLSHLTANADQEGVLICLSTTDPRTIALYEKHGFRIVSETDQSGAPNHHMERTPKGS